MPPRTTKWPIEPHTLAKHAILRSYLGGWMPTMTLGPYGHGRVLVIDGFAGPGEYEGGEEGSPIIALRTYLEHNQRAAMEKAEFVFLFIDNDKERIEYLEEIALPRLGEMPPNVRYQCVHSSFDESINEILDGLKERAARLAPCFAFVDPFGFSDTPMEIIGGLLQNPYSEVQVTFMTDWVNRFLEHPDEKIAKHYDKLFGNRGWRDLVQADDRIQAIGSFYVEQLRNSAKYVWPFRMLNAKNRPIYDLFFASNHIDGLKKFKHAVWRVDPVGGARFSDRREDTITIFEPEPDMSQLQRELRENFDGQTVSYARIEEWVVTETPFHDSHIKRRTLKPLEDAGKIEFISSIFRPRKMKGTYPPGCQIRFLTEDELKGTG